MKPEIDAILKRWEASKQGYERVTFEQGMKDVECLIRFIHQQEATIAEEQAKTAGLKAELRNAALTASNAINRALKTFS